MVRALRAICLWITVLLAACDSGGSTPSGRSGSGTVALRIRPNWDAADPRNLGLLRLRASSGHASLVLFKNGIYLRVLLTDNEGAQINLAVDLVVENWIAGESHSVAVTWNGAEIVLYIDARERLRAPYSGDLPPALGFDISEFAADADATLTDLLEDDRALDVSELSRFYEATVTPIPSLPAASPASPAHTVPSLTATPTPLQVAVPSNISIAGVASPTPTPTPTQQ